MRTKNVKGSIVSKTFKAQFSTAFRLWALHRELTVVVPQELRNEGQCAAWFHENGLVTVKLWDKGTSTPEEITLPGHQVLALIGGAK